METPRLQWFFTPKEKISINFQSGYTDSLFPLAGCSHQELHNTRKSLVHNKNVGALVPPFPVEMSPLLHSAEQPPTSHLMLFNWSISLGHMFFHVTSLGVYTKRPADANT